MTCQACDGRATLFLCTACTSKLRDLLEAMPWWLDRLSEAVVGQVNLGDGGGGRSTARREPFKGEDGVLPACTCGHPEHIDDHCICVDRKTITTTVLENNNDGELVEVEVEAVIETPCRCTDYQPAVNQAKLRAQFLAAGRINSRAADRLDQVRNTITKWLKHLCDQQHADWVTFIDPYPNAPNGFIGPLLPGWRRGTPTRFIGPLLPGHFRRYTYPGVHDACHWLAWHTHTIARTDSAGRCLADFQDHTTAIEKVINRPIPTRYLGKCPTWNDHTRRVCGTELRCREGDVQVTCPACRQTHNPDRLQLLMMNDLEREKLTIKQILGLRLPDEYQISERTLRRWRKPGPKGEPPRLKPCGYRRASDGREVINRHSEDDEPLYRWADVRKLRAEKPDPKVGAR